MRSRTSFGRSAIAAAAVVVVTSGAAQASLLVHYRLDETSGQTAADSAGTAENGTSAAASPQWLPGGGMIGGGLRFGATAQADIDENVTHTASSSFIAAYPATIASWIRTTSVATYRQTFVYLGNQLVGDQYLQTSLEPTSNRATGAARNTTFVGANGAPAVNDGIWHHVLTVYASPTSRIVYVDGKQTATSATSVTLPATTRLSLGVLMRNTPTDAFTGELDDVGLWDESLSAVRVALLHGLGRLGGVNLGDASIAAVEGVYTAQSGQATSGPYAWRYATGLPSTVVGTTGTVGSDPYIVLDTGGNGVMAVPEPATAGACGVAAAFGLLSRRRRKAPFSAR